MMLAPTGKLAVANVACRTRAADCPGVKSMLVVVSKKSALPVGVPEPGALAVALAVKVKDCPKLDELADTPRAVVVLSLLTAWLGADEVLAQLGSPP